MKKIILALMFVFALSSCIYADEPESTDIESCPPPAFLIQRELGNSTGFRTKDGINIMYMGTFRNKQPEKNEASPDEEIKADEGIFSVFMVRSCKDTQLKLDILGGIENKTNKFSYRSGDWGYISDTLSNTSPRDIPARFWVRVTFWHVLPFKFGERPLITNIGFVINGNQITLKRLRPKTWGDWQYIESHYVKPLEEDNMRIEFEELEVKPAN